MLHMVCYMCHNIYFFYYFIKAENLSNDHDFLIEPRGETLDLDPLLSEKKADPSLE